MNRKRRYIKAALEVINSLGLPRAQQNERSALCLLALLNLTPDKVWADAESPLMGITPIMDWAREHYGKEYAPNTRETVRRQTIHQFCDAGIALYNPDKPNRPVNSPKAVYQIEPAALVLLRSFSTPTWDGVDVDSHGKMPDVVLHYTEKDWLLLVESVTSHGPVDGKRHAELAQLFSGSKAGLIYVTAFPSRGIMARYLGEISWETEVWVAENPSHLIHFDGERFLGPYDAP
jgi:hypothetical protein